MPHAKSDSQPKKKPSEAHKDSPYYLPFKIVQIKQNDQGESSVEEAQADFVSQAGMPKALPDENKSDDSRSEK